jgi:hypothetical protein
MEFLGVVAADDHGESVFEAERLGNFEMVALGVELLDAVEDGDGIAVRGFVEDGGESGAGVFDVEVEFACEEGFVDEEGAAEVGRAKDRDGGFCFDVLGKELGEDDLLGEEFGADGDFGLGRLAARRKAGNEVKETNEVKESGSSAAHG